MQSLALVLASSLALFAEAAPQAAPAAPSPAPAPSPPTMSTNATNQFVITTVSAATAARVVPVVVGGTALTFTPNSVMANPGDIIQFQFDASNHTVTQSGETTPCQPLQATQPNAIHSGFIPFDQASGMVGTFNMPVTSTDPMFLYCAQGPHCQLGMVMTINANGDQLVKYAQLAAQAKTNVPANNIVGGTTVNIPLAKANFGAPAAAPAPPGVAPMTASPAAAPAPVAPASTVNVTTPGMIRLSIPLGVSTLPGGNIPPAVAVLTMVTPSANGPPVMTSSPKAVNPPMPMVSAAPLANAAESEASESQQPNAGLIPADPAFGLISVPPE